MLDIQYYLYIFQVYFYLNFLTYKELNAVLSTVANVVDLHGDAPTEYSLEEISELSDFYVKTGTYND